MDSRLERKAEWASSQRGDGEPTDEQLDQSAPRDLGSRLESLASTVCPCVPQTASSRLWHCNMHINRARLTPDQMNAMPSQREGQGFESP
jgi:hypothetical protein